MENENPFVVVKSYLEWSDEKLIGFYKERALEVFLIELRTKIVGLLTEFNAHQEVPGYFDLDAFQLPDTKNEPTREMAIKWIEEHMDVLIKCE